MYATTASVVLDACVEPPHARLHTYDHRPPIAAVKVDGGNLSLSATSPAALLALAEAFTDAAQQLAAALDEQAVTA